MRILYAAMWWLLGSGAFFGIGTLYAWRVGVL